jgi:hypothetical protein
MAYLHMNRMTASKGPATISHPIENCSSTVSLASQKANEYTKSLTSPKNSKMHDVTFHFLRKGPVMKPPARLIIGFLICTFLLLAVKAQPARNQQIIYDVTDVSWAAASVTSVKLTVKGKTTTPKWTDLTLLPSVKHPSSENDFHFDAVGLPPSGTVPQMITPVDFTYSSLPAGQYREQQASEQ